MMSWTWIRRVVLAHSGWEEKRVGTLEIWDVADVRIVVELAMSGPRESESNPPSTASTDLRVSMKKRKYIAMASASARSNQSMRSTSSADD